MKMKIASFLVKYTGRRAGVATRLIYSETDNGRDMYVRLADQRVHNASSRMHDY